MQRLNVRILLLALSVLIAISNVHGQIEKHIEEARQLAADGKLDEAVALLRNAANQQEHIWNAHLLKLQILRLYQAAGKLEETAGALIAALRQRPYDAEMLWMIAQANWIMGDMWNAIRYLIRSVGAAPSIGAYYAWLGKAYLELGMTYHAEAVFDIAVRLDPMLFWVVKELSRAPVKEAQPQPPIQQPEQPKPSEKPQPPEQPKPPEKPQPPTQPPGQPKPPEKPQLPVLPTPQRQYQADIAPNGAVARFLFKGQLCFINLGFRVAPPGWGWPPLFRQVDMQPINVKREERDGTITFTGIFTAGDNSVQWVQTITQTDEAMEMTWELTPLNDIKVESVLIEAWIRVTDVDRWFVVTGGKADLKPFPEKPPQGLNPVFFTNNTLDPVGWVTKGGAAVLIEMEKQPGAFWWFQDDRLYGMGFFELQLHCGIRNIWRKGQTAAFALTIRPFAEAAQQ